MKIRISVILRVVVSVGLVSFLLWSMRSHFPHIGKTLAKTNPLLFSLAALLFLSNAIVLSSRLYLVFAGEDIRIPFGRVVQLTFIGFFFNNFMPSAIGGDIIKAYYASKHTKETAKSFISVFMDRFLGLFSFAFIAAFVLLLSWGSIDMFLKKIILMFVFFGSIAFLIILNRTMANFIFKALSRLKLWRIGERLSRVYRVVHEYKNRKGLIFSAMGISIVSQCTYFTIVYILGKSLNANLLLKMVFLIMPIVSVVSLLPSLGGLGLREGAMVALFGAIIGAENAFSVSILLLAGLLLLSLVGAIIYIFAPQFRVAPAEISKLEEYNV